MNEKKSLLCVGIDPAEPGQRSGGDSLAEGVDKFEYCLDFIEKIAPYAAAIKPNRQYFKDLSREEMKKINAKAHSLGMVSIDDSKLADIGDTNAAGFYHARMEDFDAVTYAPFPGNIPSACSDAHNYGVGIIVLALMSNPEFQKIKNLEIEGQPAYIYFTKETVRNRGDGVVLGAPSPKNHITQDEILRIRENLDQGLVLVPGIGAQGGAMESIVSTFGKNAIINVGRAIFYSSEPEKIARDYQEQTWKLVENHG